MLVGCLAAAETEASEEVLFKGFPLRPWADLQGSDAAFEFHPLAALGTGGDSNPRQSPSGSNDTWAQGTVGLQARSLGSEGGDLVLGFELGRKLYAETSDRNATTYDGSIAGTWRGTTAQGQIAASWVRDDAPVRAFPESTLRDQQDASATTSVDFRRWRLSGDLSVVRTDYLESTPHFSDVDQDTLRAGASVEPALLGADRSLLGLRVGAGQTWRPDDASRSGGWDAAAEVHWRHVIAERSTLDLLAGGQLRVYQDATAGDATNSDDQITAATIHAVLTWPWEEGSQVVLSIGQGLEDGTSANAATALDAMIEGRLRLADRWSATLLAARWRTEDSGAVSPAGREHLNGRRCRLASQYLLRQGLGLRAYGEYSAIDATVGDSWERWYAGIELAASL